MSPSCPRGGASTPLASPSHSAIPQEGLASPAPSAIPLEGLEARPRPGGPKFGRRKSKCPLAGARPLNHLPPITRVTAERVEAEDDREEEFPGAHGGSRSGLVMIGDEEDCTCDEGSLSVP